MRPVAAGLMYHDVADDPASSGFQRPAARGYRMSVERFVRHLGAMRAAEVTPRLVSSVDLALPGSHLFLTFDDGGRSALRIADLLARQDWRGHFFIVTGHIGAPTFLNAAEIRYLRSCGHIIGSHSHTHPDIFRDLNGPRLRDEWRTSRMILSDLLGEPCLAAAVPGGDSSPAVYAAAGHAGFEYLFTSEPRLIPERVRTCWILGRVALRSTSSPEAAAQLARFRGWGRARLVRTLKATVRGGLAPLYRRYVSLRTRTRPGIAAPALTSSPDKWPA